MLCYAMLCYTPHHTTPHHTAPHRTAPHRTAPHYTPGAHDAAAASPGVYRGAVGSGIGAGIGVQGAPTKMYTTLDCIMLHYYYSIDYSITLCYIT